MFDRESLSVFSEVAKKLDQAFVGLPAFEDRSSANECLAEVLNATAERLQADAEAAASRGTAGLCAGDVD